MLLGISTVPDSPTPLDHRDATGRRRGTGSVPADHLLDQNRPVVLRPACGRDGRTSGGTGGLAIGMHLTAPAERAGRPGVPARHRPSRPGSQSKYIGSLPARDMKLVDPAIAIGPFAQLRA
jgi:hypothetical protein